MLLWSLLQNDVEREALSAEIVDLETDPLRLTAHPAIMDESFEGLATFDKSIDSDDVMIGRTLADISETGTYADTTPNFDRDVLSVGLKYIQFSLGTDVATAGAQRINAAMLALSMIGAINYTITGLIAEAGSTFTAEYVDASGADMTSEDLFDAISAHQSGAGYKPSIGVFHPDAITQLQKDVTFTQAMNNASQGPLFEALKRFAPDAYVGQVDNCSLFRTPQVPVVGGKRSNCIFSRGGIAIGGRAPAVQSADQILLGRLRFTQQSSQVGPSGLYRGETYLGANIIVDAKGGRVLTAS